MIFHEPSKSLPRAFQEPQSHPPWASFVEALLRLCSALFFGLLWWLPRFPLAARRYQRRNEKKHIFQNPLVEVSILSTLVFLLTLLVLNLALILNLWLSSMSAWGT